MAAEETFDESPTESSPDGDSAPDYLVDVDDGAGCTEIWEHLSERRDDESDEE